MGQRLQAIATVSLHRLQVAAGLSSEHRRLLGDPCLVAAGFITEGFRVLPAKVLLTPRIVVCVQTYGNFAIRKPHPHCIVTDSGFRPGAVLHVLPRVSLAGKGSVRGRWMHPRAREPRIASDHMLYRQEATSEDEFFILSRCSPSSHFCCRPVIRRPASLFPRVANRLPRLMQRFTQAVGHRCHRRAKARSTLTLRVLLRNHRAPARKLQLPRRSQFASRHAASGLRAPGPGLAEPLTFQRFLTRLTASNQALPAWRE